MAKGTTVRHREKKKPSSTDHFPETKVNNSASTNVSSIKENVRDQSLWRYCVFAILLSVGSASLFYLKDTELFSRTRRAFSSTDQLQTDKELPCHFGDDFTVDRRSNLSLEEFIRCYDAKRY